MVEEEAGRELIRRDAEAELDRGVEANEPTRAAAPADRERLAKGIVAAFLDAMRRVGSPGVTQ